MVKSILCFILFFNISVVSSQIRAGNYVLENIDLTYYNEVKDTLYKYFSKVGSLGSFIEFREDATFYLKLYIINKRFNNIWYEGYGNYKDFNDSIMLDFQQYTLLNNQLEKLPSKFYSIKKVRPLIDKIKVNVSVIRSLRNDTLKEVDIEAYLWKGTKESLDESPNFFKNSFELPFKKENVNWELSAKVLNNEVNMKETFWIREPGEYQVTYNTSRTSTIVSNGKFIITRDINNKMILHFKSQLFLLNAYSRSP